jgi:hypothetical protein
MCEYRIYVESDLNIETFSDFEPIPLTEEWLLKFGFEWKNHGLHKDNWVIRQFGGDWTIFLSNEKYNFDIKLCYVHQLQNLYFALTGEELKQHE